MTDSDLAHSLEAVNQELARVKRERDDHQMQATMLQAMVDDVSKHDAALERERDELKAAGDELHELVESEYCTAAHHVRECKHWRRLTTPQTMEDTK